MRITIDIDDELIQRAKELGARTNRPLQAVIEDALRESLANRKPSPVSDDVELPVSSQGGGGREGVNLDCSADLLDLMERPDACE